MGNLYIVATPIGNLQDITIRAIKTLLKVKVIACEDTRRTGQLLIYLNTHYSNFVDNVHNYFPKKYISFYDEIEENKSLVLISILKKGDDIALVSDAGTPLLSDPGYKLINLAVKNRINVIPIPGPSSLITSLVVSGFPINNIFYLGFLPSKVKKRQQILSKLCDISVQSQLKPLFVCFQPVHSIRETIGDIFTIFSNPDIRVAKEMTKLNEDIIRIKSKNDLLNPKFDKGEFVLMFQ